MTAKTVTMWAVIAGLGVTVGPFGCVVDGMEDDALLDEAEGPGPGPGGGSFKGDPVIFIHGCTPPGFTDADSVHDYDAWVAYFSEHGYPADHLVVFQNMEEQCTSITRYAAQIEDLIKDTLAATRKSKVDIVAQSMGAIAVRYYFFKEGTGDVRDFVSVGGVHHGTEGGLFAELGANFWQEQFGGPPWFEGIHELNPSYACAGQSYGAAGGHGFPTLDIQLTVNGCLTPTGRTTFKDETPGSVRYVSVWNTIDDIIIPQQSACLDMKKQNDCSSPINKSVTVPAAECFPGFVCPAHLMMLYDPDVIRRGFNFVGGRPW